MWQSNAPIPTVTSVVSPSLSAHSALSVPAGWSAVNVSSGSLSVNPSKRGSNDAKKSLGGNPPNASAHNDLCPAEQTPRLMSATRCPPQSRNGIQSQCSTQECVAVRTCSSSRNTCSSLAQNHSDE